MRSGSDESHGDIRVEALQEPRQCLACRGFSLEGVSMEKTSMSLKDGSMTVAPLFMCENCVKTSLNYKRFMSLHIIGFGRIIFVGVNVN